jgi:xanthine dehydrogenase small subunit
VRAARTKPAASKLEAFYTGLQAQRAAAGRVHRGHRVAAPGSTRHFRAHKISKRFEQDISATCAAMSWKLTAGD